MQHEIKIIKFAALLTEIAMDTAVKLQNRFAAGGLVKPVDVLGDDGPELALTFPPGQLFVGGVGPHAGNQELCPVKAEKFFGVAFIECMA